MRSILEEYSVDGSECIHCKFSAMCLPTSWQTIEENLFKCGGCGAFFFATEIGYMLSGIGRFSAKWSTRLPSKFVHIRLPTCLLAKLFSKQGLQAEIMSSDVCPLCKARTDSWAGDEEPIGRRPWKKPHVQVHRV